MPILGHKMCISEEIALFSSRREYPSYPELCQYPAGSPKVKKLPASDPLRDPYPFPDMTG